MAGERPGERRGLAGRLGVDSKGRPAFQKMGDDMSELYRWEHDLCEVVELRDAVAGLSIYVFIGGLLVEEVSTDGMLRLDGRPAVTVTRWEYEERRPTQVTETYESGSHSSWGGPERGPYWKAHVHTFTYDEAGDLATITVHGSIDGIADGEDAEVAQAAAAAGFPEAYNPPHLIDDARTQRVESDLPHPKRAYDTLAEPVADALVAALRGAARDVGHVGVPPRCPTRGGLAGGRGRYVVRRTGARDGFRL